VKSSFVKKEALFNQGRKAYWGGPFGVKMKSVLLAAGASSREGGKASVTALKEKKRKV